MRHVVQSDHTPAFPLHRDGVNPTIVGLKSPFPGAVEPQGTQPYRRADPTVRHHNKALGLCRGQDLLDGLHGPVIKLPPRLSSRWSHVVGVGTSGSIDFWIVLLNFQR